MELRDLTDTGQFRALSALAADLSAERIAASLRDSLLDGDGHLESGRGVLEKFPWED